MGRQKQKDMTAVSAQIWHIPDILRGREEFVTMLGWNYPPTSPLKIGTMSLHLYHLAGKKDKQKPHTEDEAYYVVKGAGKVTVEAVTRNIKEGDLIFVPRCSEHRFHDYNELAVLVFFAPPFTYTECKRDKE